MYALRTYFFFLWWCDAVDEERGILRICRRLLWLADVLVTFHEVFTGQGNSKLLPVWTFDVDVLQIIFHSFEDANSNDCAISLRKFAWNAPWYLRIFSTLTENTILAPNDNHLDGYEYFLFMFLSSLLVLFLFLLGFYFFLNTKRRVSW